jgi:hypothetical protein
LKLADLYRLESLAAPVHDKIYGGSFDEDLESLADELIIAIERHVVDAEMRAQPVTTPEARRRCGRALRGRALRIIRGGLDA